MKLKITITKEIIDKSLMCGVPGHCYNKGSHTSNCMVAEALKQFFPNISVAYSSFNPFTGVDHKALFIRLPEKATKMIIKFDNLRDTPEERKQFIGQSFEIDVPDEVIDYY